MDKKRHSKIKKPLQSDNRSRNKDVWGSFCLYVVIARLLKALSDSKSTAKSPLSGRRCTSYPDLSRSDFSTVLSPVPGPSVSSQPAGTVLSSGIKTASEILQELRGYTHETGPYASYRSEEKYFVVRIDDSSLKTFKRQLYLKKSISDESVGIVVALVKETPKQRKKRYLKYKRTPAKARKYTKKAALLKIFRSSAQNFVFYTIPTSSLSDSSPPCLSYYCFHRDYITIRYHKDSQTVAQETVLQGSQTDKLTSNELRNLLQRAVESEPVTDTGHSFQTQAEIHSIPTSSRKSKGILDSIRGKFHEETTKVVTFLNGHEQPPSPAPFDNVLERIRRPINVIRNSNYTPLPHTSTSETDQAGPSGSSIGTLNIEALNIYEDDFQRYDIKTVQRYHQPDPPTIYHYVPNKYIPKVSPPPHSNSLFWKRRHRDKKAYVELDSPVETEVEDFEEDSPNDDFRYCYFVGPYRFPRAFTLPPLEHSFDCPVDEKGRYKYSSPPSSPKKKPKGQMGRMGSLEDHERKVIIEFCHLLEKSKQLFNGLRELPQYGHKQWHSYFGRTFDVYTKLWKFQQQHRYILDSKYGLKRWQIGEIASKIGQLYYHFYLRTSETAYLNEAYSFYHAIRGRSYYTKASKEDKCELMVKKLRYYARFIVACLLLKKVMLVRELIKELDRQIIEYGSTYDPDDQIEWTVVVDEVKAFIQSEPVVSVIHPDNYPMVLSHRLSAMNTPPVERMPQMNLTLQEVIIVGSSSQQVKFSELTLDMFRMLQTLEREPTREMQHMYDDSPRQRFNMTPSAIHNKGFNLETGMPQSDNPHKYLLFKPALTQILVYLASACNDMPSNGALLLYMSADGQIAQPSKHPEDVAYDIGGLITTSKNEVYRESSKDQKGASKKEQQVFHPGDMYPFTRRPLFIIIESDNSYVFQNMPRHFGQPMVILMSPLETPTALNASTSDRRHQGSLFTLFLHSPLTAFCHCCDIHNIALAHWDRAQSYVDAFMAEASQIVCRRIDPVYLSFMGDDFLRLLILRYVFCEAVLRMHRSFRSRSQLPRCSPPIADELIEHPSLSNIVMDLVVHLQVRASFHDTTVAGPPPAKE